MRMSGREIFIPVREILGMGTDRLEQAPGRARGLAQSAPHPLTHPLCSPPGGPNSPVEDVVILTAPAPVLVGEAIDSQKLGFTQARYTSKVASIGQPKVWEGRCQ